VTWAAHWVAAPPNYQPHHRCCSSQAGDQGVAGALLLWAQALAWATVAARVRLARNRQAAGVLRWTPASQAAASLQVESPLHRRQSNVRRSRPRRPRQPVHLSPLAAQQCLHPSLPSLAHQNSCQPHLRAAEQKHHPARSWHGTARPLATGLQCPVPAVLQQALQALLRMWQVPLVVRLHWAMHPVG
jgi:hypothetical protein